MDTYSDNALMLKVKEGDLEKLGPLFERYHRKLFRFFYRLTYRKDLSRDLVQGVFERIIRYRHTYEGRDNASFETWIYRVARNHHIDHYRKTRPVADDAGFDPEQLEGSLSADPFDADIDAEADREQQLLMQALDRLDETKRETLVLSRFEGFRYREIAGILECSESAVKVRIFRALQELKAIITELQNQEDYD